MIIYEVYEYLELGRSRRHAYYLNRYDAEVHVKLLKQNARYYTGDDPSLFSITEIEVKDSFDPTQVEGYRFDPKWIHIVAYPFTGRVNNLGFVTAMQDASNAKRCIIYINSDYQFASRSWRIEPWLEFYMPYVKLPYDQLQNKVQKYGDKMLQRVKNKIDFTKYYGMTPAQLERKGWTLPEETKKRWDLLTKNVESYYATDPNRPITIDIQYMYKCCPGVFTQGIHSPLNWHDYAYKYLDEV